MSTTPVPIQTKTTSGITTDLAWLKAHLALLVIVIALAAGSVYGIESIIAKHDAERATADRQVLTAITNQTNDLKSRMTQDEQASAVRDAQYNQTISQLSAIISNQSTQLRKQIKVNASLTASQTAQALTTKIKAQPGEISVAGDNVTLDLPVARSLNSSLDSLATTQAQLVETQKQLSAQTSLTTDALLDLDNGKKVIASQQTEISAAGKSCQDQVTSLKAQARKSKFKWFLGGVLVGLGIAHPLGI